MKLTKNKNNKKVNKTKLAKNLGVCRQSLYYKPKLPAKDLELKKQIEEVLVEHKSYGHRRIAIHLGINKKRVSRVMKLFNLSPTRKPKMLHSDQGSEYKNEDFTNILKSNLLLQQ